MSDEAWTGDRLDPFSVTTTGTISFNNTTGSIFYPVTWPNYQWPTCSCHQRKSLRELITELRDRLREEREVALELKELIAELQSLQKRGDFQEIVSTIGANPEGGLP